MRWDSQRKGWRQEYSKDYDELKAMRDVRKDRLVSVITSDKTITKGHRKRLEFVRRLEREIGGDLDVFITSNMGLEDKWEAIGRYRYHIVLENSVYPDYWSEKLADPLLGLCYPIYFGCPNIYDYFPRGSIMTMDIGDFDRSLAIIRGVIGSDIRERNMVMLQEAKDLVLDRYNVFPMLAEILPKLPAAEPAREIVLRPELIIPRTIKHVRAGIEMAAQTLFSERHREDAVRPR